MQRCFCTWSLAFAPVKRFIYGRFPDRKQFIHGRSRLNTQQNVICSGNSMLIFPFFPFKLRSTFEQLVKNKVNNSNCNTLLDWSHWQQKSNLNWIQNLKHCFWSWNDHIMIIFSSQWNFTSPLNRFDVTKWTHQSSIYDDEKVTLRILQL